MKRGLCLLLAPLMMGAAPIALIADLSQRRIDINTRFTGNGSDDIRRLLSLIVSFCR